MSERQKLFKQIKEREKFLRKQRWGWFLMVWAGYTVAIFYLWYGLTKVEDWVSILTIAIASAIFAFILWGVNATIWPHYVHEIESSVKYLEQLHREYNALDLKEREKLFTEMNKRN